MTILTDLFYQVFGTAVDWRTTIVEALKKHAEAALSHPLPPELPDRVASIDWPAFAESWRATYVKLTRGKPGSGSDHAKRPYKSVDEHYHDSLKEMLQQHELQDLWSANEVTKISKTWHYLEAWPDSSSGVNALNNLGLQTCTLSNGDVALLKDMADFAHLPWTHIFSSENFGVFKPSKEVYLGGVEKLGLQPDQCAMVAAHLTDLWHARKYGLKTIYIERQQEEGWDEQRVAKAKEDGWVDIWVALSDGEDEKHSFLELARILSINDSENATK